MENRRFDPITAVGKTRSFEESLRDHLKSIGLLPAIPEALPALSVNN